MLGSPCMNTQIHQVQELEILLLRTMARLLVLDPNAMLKIEQSVSAIRNAGAELDSMNDWVSAH